MPRGGDAARARRLGRVALIAVAAGAAAACHGHPAPTAPASPAPHAAPAAAPTAPSGHVAPSAPAAAASAAPAAPVATSTAPAARPAPTARRPAPPLGLTDLTGKPVSLAALRGKVVLLDFWATWCEPCRTEMPHLAALQKRDGPRGLQIIGLSLDDRASTVRTFLAAHPLPYPVAMASTGLARRYGGILGLPTVFLLDRQGRIAARHQGLIDPASLDAVVDRLLAE